MYGTVMVIWKHTYWKALDLNPGFSVQLTSEEHLRLRALNFVEYPHSFERVHWSADYWMDLLADLGICLAENKTVQDPQIRG